MKKEGGITIFDAMDVTPVLRDTRSLRPFKSSEEYLYAMKEDLAEWLQLLYPDLRINVTNFMDRLDTGVALCKHANNVRRAAEEYIQRRLARRSASSANLVASMSTSTTGTMTRNVVEGGNVHFLPAAQPGTFFARDNVSNFIRWCRQALGVFECLLFETDDLILRKNERNVILCLLDVARRGAKLGMAAPMLVQLEREIDREVAAEQRALQRANSVATESADSDDDEDLVPLGPVPQIVTNDLKSLDEMVRELVERCTCPVQFPMIRVSEGKYRIGDTKVLIFVRVLRNHVMVRVGGGWDTLSHYLDKHDPCRCKTAHRSPLSAKLILKQTGSLELDKAHVIYERSPPRTRRSSASSVSSGGKDNYLCAPTPPPPPAMPARSRSPTPRRSLAAPRHNSNTRSRSRSPAAPVKANAVEVASTPAPVTVGSTDPHNDSGSEVSDEGYRSLGTLGLVSGESQKPEDAPKSNGGTTEVDAETQERPELCRHTSSSDSVESSDDPPTATAATDLSTASTDDTTMTSVASITFRRPGSACSNDGAPPSPRRMASLDVPPTSGSAPASPARKLSQQKQQTSGNSMTRSRSTCAVDSGFVDAPAELFNPSPPRRSAPQYRSLRANSASPSKPPSSTSNITGTGTWSGRQGRNKPRTPVSESTFNRTSLQRRSLGAYGTATPSNNNHSAPPSPRRQPKKSSLPASLQTSPTKISPLLEQVLSVKELDNDVTVLNKMRQIIQQYADLVGGAAEPPSEELDLTSAWVHGNGSLARRRGSCCSIPGDLAAPAPRKDSAGSRIPAPVSVRAPSVVSAASVDS